MEFRQTKIPGCFVIENTPFNDDRGKFVKPFSFDVFEKGGIKFDVKENFYSDNGYGVIRGMHFQIPPMDHDKIVYVLNGTIIDVVVDLRKDSPTFKKYISEYLSSNNNKSIYVPKGCAHGFQSLSDFTIVSYLQSSCYSKEHDSGIKYDSFGFLWPTAINESLISDRDKKFKKLEDFQSPF